MPTATWRNLPADKRARITDVAMQEFGARGFSAGSLNVIAKNAGIAKGSLFQYFDDKLDLFVAICEAGAADIEAAVLAGNDPDAPLFDNVREMAARWVAFYRSHPMHRAIAHASANEIDATARIAVREVTNARLRAALQPMVRAAMERGELRADVDEAIVLSMVPVVLRHLSSAPFDPAGDVAIRLTELPDQQVDRWGTAYVDALEAAFT
jgi:AcrR family transcriptional regulator